MASVEESKVLLSQILEKEFSEALQDSESFNKMKVTAIIQQAMTGFVRGVTGTEMDFTSKNDAIDAAINSLYSNIENYLALEETEEDLEPVFEIDVEFKHDDVLEEEINSETETTTPEPEIQVVYYIDSDEPLLEIDVFADGGPKSEPEERTPAQSTTMTTAPSTTTTSTRSTTMTTTTRSTTTTSTTTRSTTTTSTTTPSTTMTTTTPSTTTTITTTTPTPTTTTTTTLADSTTTKGSNSFWQQFYG